MLKYICISPEKAIANHVGDRVGTQKKRALFYSLNIGKRRIYRQAFDSPDPDMRILAFATESAAAETCREINLSCNDSFEVEEIKLDK